MSVGRVPTGKDGLEQRTATADTPAMRLFHFSDDPEIAVFEPRPVLIPAERAPGKGWLNGPLVWAIEDDWQALYLFPRDCPRILLSPKPTTSLEDMARWFPPGSAQMIAYVEQAWFERILVSKLYRYELPCQTFEPLEDAGMWVSNQAVVPIARNRLANLLELLATKDVELRVVESLLPLSDIWASSLHASGIRLRNAQGWLATGQPLRATGR